MSISPTPSTSSSATMASQDNTPLLGKQAQTLIKCNQKLQELGIDRTISLPRICVIGDQSTGKSSLIESISTIKVPKAKGCCTQCPVAINLSSGVEPSSPWTCTVSIEQHYDFDKSLASAGVSRTNPFGPWQKRQQLKIIRVKTTDDKDEVPKLIAAAQLAILNPDTQIQDWLQSSSRRGNGDEPDNSMTKFSPNVIRIDVSEGSWGNLSFIDLPGVIVNTQTAEDRWLVKLINNLVCQYAVAEKSINMLCLPMTHDIENSNALAIIQKLKAHAHTLAVFTKADLADADQRAQFLRKVEDPNHLGFKYGYSFVAMPDNVESEEARQIEAGVFSKDTWPLLNQNLRSRLGIDNLSKYLRRILFEKTKEALPGNLESIKMRLNTVAAELAVLPTPPNSMVMPMQLLTSFANFESQMKSLFSGDSTGSGPSARIAWNKNIDIFQNTVTKAMPVVSRLTRKEQARLNKAAAKLKKPQTIDPDKVVELSSDDDTGPSAPVKAELSANNKFDAVHRFGLEEIRRINTNHYRANVPKEIELRAVDEMYGLGVEHWDTLLEQFMDNSSKLLFSQVKKVIDDAFGCYRHLQLYQIILDQVNTYIGGVLEHERACADVSCRLERESPLTRDSGRLKVKENEYYADRKAERTEQRMELLRAEREVTEGKQKRKVDEKELPDDPYDTELSMSAKASAYYDIASSRFIDVISLGILGRLLPSCTTKLVDDLKEYLGCCDTTKHHQIIGWMTEDPEREAKRQQLIQEQTRLTVGLDYIEDVLGGPRSSPSKRSYNNDSDANDEYRESPSKRALTNRTRQSEEIQHEDTEMID